MYHITIALLHDRRPELNLRVTLYPSANLFTATVSMGICPLSLFISLQLKKSKSKLILSMCKSRVKEGLGESRRKEGEEKVKEHF